MEVLWSYINITPSPHKPNADLMKKLDERECSVLSMKLVCVSVWIFLSLSPFVFTGCRSLVLIMQSSQCRVVIAIKMKSLFDWKQQQQRTKNVRCMRRTRSIFYRMNNYISSIWPLSHIYIVVCSTYFDGRFQLKRSYPNSHKRTAGKKWVFFS